MEISKIYNNDISCKYCPVCKNKTEIFDSIEFNKSCEEINGKYLSYTGQFIDYYICENCEFCFAPEIFQWNKKDFEEKIYNKDYIFVDPEYKEIRSKRNANLLLQLLKNSEKYIKHLDYGGGNGTLSKILNENGICSTAYDPYAIDNLLFGEKYNLLTAFEVFEHVNDIELLFYNLTNLLSDDGCVIFSTALNDDHLSNNNNLSSWWYASPRNGHISLFSQKSLEVLAAKYNLEFKSINYLGIHIFYKSKQLWFKNIDDQAEQNYTFSKKINLFNNYISNLVKSCDSIVLYGFGLVAKVIVSLYPDKVKMIIDKDINKQNTEINNIPIKNPSELETCYYDAIFITVLGREDQIHNFLIQELKVNDKCIKKFKMSYQTDSVKNYLFAKELNSFYSYTDSLFFGHENIVLYGFSIIAKIVIALYPQKIQYVLDGNSEIQGTQFHGINIINPGRIKSLEYDLILITALGRENIIRNVLVNEYNTNLINIEILHVSKNSGVSDREFGLRLSKHREKVNIDFAIYPYAITPEIKTLHLIFFMGIGDFIYTTPLWVEIKKQFPDIRLVAYVSRHMDLINNPLVHDLIERNPMFHQVYYFNGQPGASWEEYDFSDANKNIIREDSSDLICPVVFKHTDVHSIHRVDEIFKAFSLKCDPKQIPLPLVYIAKSDYSKSSNITNHINRQTKEVVFLHLETRSTDYNYNDDEALIQELIDRNYYVVYIKKNGSFDFDRNSFFNLNINTFNLFESIAFIESIKVKKYFIATNSLMTPISSALKIPMLALFILKDSTQTRLVFYKNIRVITIDKECYNFLPQNYCLLISTQKVDIFNGNLVRYNTQTIMESFLHFFK